MKKQLILHIGTHKTGSTSLQRFLVDHAAALGRHGIALYRGQLREDNHVELHLAALRYDRDTFRKQFNNAGITFDERFTQQVAERVQHFIRARPEPRILFTSEGLSWLRHDDEIDRLRIILDIGNHEATVIVYLRNKAEFLRSYIHQLYKVQGRGPAREYWSTRYIEPDTWLVDYEALIKLYQKAFGANNVIVIDYDEALDKESNIIPSFLRVLDVDPNQFDFASYFLNTTDPANQRKPPRSKPWIARLRNPLMNWRKRRAA